MAETTPPNTADAGLEVRTYFVRNRNALLARAGFSELFVDYYLHLSSNQIKVAPGHDCLFQLGEEDFTMVIEHPDCDLGWLNALTPEAMRTLDQRETLALLERRIYRWHCGCNPERMMEVLAPSMKDDPEALFGDDPKIEIRCPRCGARHTITREALEAFVART